MALTTPRAIAIVDDDDLVRAAMASLVRSFGFHVRSFSSATAYLAAETDDIACVVSDVHMPNMSGIELQDHLRVRTGAPPLILMTAFPGDKLKAAAKACGAVALVDKPVDSNDLLKLLRSAMN